MAFYHWPRGTHRHVVPIRLPNLKKIALGREVVDPSCLNSVGRATVVVTATGSYFIYRKSDPRGHPPSPQVVKPAES